MFVTDRADSFNVVGDWIYYRSYYETALYKVRVDGSEKTQLYSVCGMIVVADNDWVYFSDYDSLCKIRIDGSDFKRLIAGGVYSINVSGDWVYFGDNDSGTVNKIRKDGLGLTKLADGTADCISVIGEWLYYIDEYSGVCIKMRTDGTERSAFLDISEVSGGGGAKSDAAPTTDAPPSQGANSGTSGAISPSTGYTMIIFESSDNSRDAAKIAETRSGILNGLRTSGLPGTLDAGVLLGANNEFIVFMPNNADPQKTIDAMNISSLPLKLHSVDIQDVRGTIPPPNGGEVYAMITYEASVPLPTVEEMEVAAATVRDRLANEKYNGAAVCRAGNNRIIVFLPSTADVESDISAIGAESRLTFRDESGNVLVDGNDIIKVTPTTESNGNGMAWVVSIEFNMAGTAAFGEATAANIGKPINVCLDETLISAPIVMNAIYDGKAVITGGLSSESAGELAALINAGALPFALNVVSVMTVMN